MLKFTATQKTEAVQHYLKKAEGYRLITLKLGIEPKTFHDWNKCFEHHGEKAFIKSYTNYSAQFKLNVLNYINDQGTSVRETAAIFNLSTLSLLLSWKKEMELYGLDALEPKKKGRPSMKKDNQKQTMKQYRHALKERGITQSMSRKGNCYDNWSWRISLAS